MSLGEILVVMLIALMVTKPEDIPVIVKKIQQFKLYCLAIKKQLLLSINEGLNTDIDVIEHNTEQLNFYLQKIINIQGYYNGNYSISELKENYDRLIKKQIIESKEKQGLNDQAK